MKSANASDNKITPEQNRKIWATARQLNMDSEAVHNLVYMVTAQESLKELSKDEAIRVINEMERRINGDDKFRYVRTKQGRPVAMISKEQLWKIDQLVKQLGWDNNPKRIQGFCRKYAKTDDPRWLTKQQA